VRLSQRGVVSRRLRACGPPAGIGRSSQERAFRLDAVVQRREPIPVGIHRKLRHYPAHFPQEMNDRGNVIKLHATAEFAQVADAEPGSLGIDHRPFRITRGTIRVWLRAHHELG
jgi:hypothetical protein